MDPRPGAELLDRVRERHALSGHDGRSGAGLERVILADGTRLIVKRFDPANDLVMQLTDDPVGRELLLWQEGVLDGFPANVAHPIVGGWIDDGVGTLAMADLGDAVLGWDRVLSRRECSRIFAAMLAVHRANADRRPPASACAIEQRVAVLSPQRLAPYLTWDHPLPGAATTGWSRFHDIVGSSDPAVAQLIARIHRNPGPLAAALAARRCTLIHGDLFIVNMALDDERVTFFDWGLASWAPSWLEATMFLMGAMSNVNATIEDLVHDFRALSGDDHDEVAMRLAFVCTLADLGWNKALDATDHEDADKRARERSELDWWVAQARVALDAGLIPGA